MTNYRHSLLLHCLDGPRNAPAWLILHDRHGNLDSARDLGTELLPAHSLRIAVRSARTQTLGSIAPPKGNFWFIGPNDRPEMSTLGDGLYQLNLLLRDLQERCAIPSFSVLGEGEGATMALLLALSRPDIVPRVVARKLMVPANLRRMPFHIGEGNGLYVSLLTDTTCTDQDVGERLRRILPAVRIDSSAHGVQIPGMADCV